MKSKLRLNRLLYHFVSKFEDDGYSHFVLKTWLSHKRRWHYEVWQDYILEAVYKIDPKTIGKGKNEK